MKDLMIMCMIGSMLGILFSIIVRDSEPRHYQKQAEVISIENQVITVVDTEGGALTKP